MKGLSWFGKFMFLLNSLAAVALLLGYILPYIPPKSFPVISVLSLSVPVLILVNFIFFLFWLLQVKKQMLLSLVVLLLGINHVLSLYKFTSSDPKNEPGALRLMTYNVKQFNIYQWLDEPKSPEKIASFATEKDLDFLMIQEYHTNEGEVTKKFKYNYIKSKDDAKYFGMAIFSKYPIINAGSLNFPQDGNNNAIYADVLVNRDTLRLFNVHLQSFRLSPYVETLKTEDSKVLLKRMAIAFKKQQDQMEILVDKIQETPYRSIVGGDFNNSAFSYVYGKIKGERFNDAFKEAGNGFGQTFSTKLFPLRIDFTLVDKRINIDAFEKFEVNYSDHYPIMTTFTLKDELQGAAPSN